MNNGRRRGRRRSAAVVTVLGLCAWMACGTGALAADPFQAQDEKAAAEEGISVAQVVFDREICARAGNIAGDLTNGLGDGYAGVWFDPRAGRFHVDVAPVTNRGQAEAIVKEHGVLGDTHFDSVAHTWPELQGAEDSLQATIAQLDLTVAVRSTARSQLNGIEIEVSNELSAAQRAAVEAAARSLGVPFAVKEVPASSLAATPATARSAVEQHRHKRHRAHRARHHKGRSGR